MFNYMTTTGSDDENTSCQFCDFAMGSHHRVDAGTVRTYQANQAYVSNIYCGAIVAVGVHDKTPFLAMPVMYVRLYHIFYELDSTLVKYYSGRAASRLGSDSTYRFEPSRRQ